MIQPILEFKSNISLKEVSPSHRSKAEHKAREAFVLSLLEQGDINIVQAEELLDIDRSQLRSLASTYNISTVELDALRLGIDREILSYMKRQSELFDEMREELLSKYRGQWVVFEDGRVLDADEDETALTQRVYASHPRHLLIKQVLPFDPKPIVRTPFRFHETSLS